MYFYSAFGLSIQSEIELPELIPAPASLPDVLIRRGHVDRTPPETVAIRNGYHVMPGDAYLFWEIVGAFRVRGGSEILVEPAVGVEPQLLRIPLLGTAMAILLHQRGLLILHASAIAVDDDVVAFVGDKGQGKSTMAAALYGRGHTLLADDLVAIDVDHQSGPVVLPGFPQFKLHPEAAATALGDDPSSLSPIASIYEKCSRRAGDRFSLRSLPLRHVYTLHEASSSAIKPLSQQESVVQLIAHSHAARFGRFLLGGAEGVLHLQQCGALLEHVSVHHLERPKALEQLPLVAQLVEDHIIAARLRDTDAHRVVPHMMSIV